jgi:hypothetical protein
MVVSFARWVLGADKGCQLRRAATMRELRISQSTTTHW